MTDNITLPREVADYLMEVLEESPHHGDWSARDNVALAALRTALAAEPTKPEPVAWMDRFGSVVLGKGPYETFTTPLYTFPPDAPTVKESLTHPGYIIGSHWLETAYSRICAGEAEADVLRDCGWERVDDAEALRRDAERYRLLRRGQRWSVINGIGDALRAEELDAAIDAAMGDKR